MKMMVIRQFPSFVILEVCLTVLSSNVPVQLTSTTQTIATGYNICPCNGDIPNDQCFINEMFESIDFFREDSSRCVWQNVSANVRPLSSAPKVQTMTRFESFNNEHCLAQTNDTTVDYLSINKGSQCDPSYKCCVMCSSCPRDRILNDEGPVLLKAAIDISDFSSTQFILLIKCATNIPQPIAGNQLFELKFSKDNCLLLKSATGKTVRYSTGTESTLSSSLAMGSTGRPSSASGTTVWSSASTESRMASLSAAGKTFNSSSVTGSSKKPLSAIGRTMRHSVIRSSARIGSLPESTVSRSSVTTSFSTKTTDKIKYSIPMPDIAVSTTNQGFILYLTTSHGHDTLRNSPKSCNAAHALSVKSVFISILKLVLVLSVASTAQQ